MAKDKRRMSQEKHEIRYAKTLAAKEIDKIKGKKSNYTVIIQARTLKRICRAFIILYEKKGGFKR